MEMTLLEMTQDILNDLDGDEVNSIDDTAESSQVSQIIKSTYYAMMSSRNWAHLRQTITMTASGNNALPNYMSLPDNVKELCFINYNKVKDGETKKTYQSVRYLEPDDFLRVTNRRNSDNATCDVIVDQTTGLELLILNNQGPTYYTSFDDKNVVFDSYDNLVDTTLQESKVQAQAYVMPTWTHMDSFVPDLPSEAFTALLEEAKSRAMLKLKQVQDFKAEQEATRQHRWLARKNSRINGGIRLPNYGRSGRKYTRDVTFNREDY